MGGQRKPENYPLRPGMSARARSDRHDHKNRQLPMGAIRFYGVAALACRAGHLSSVGGYTCMIFTGMAVKPWRKGLASRVGAPCISMRMLRAMISSISVAS